MKKIEKIIYSSECNVVEKDVVNIFKHENSEYPLEIRITRTIPSEEIEQYHFKGKTKGIDFQRIYFNRKDKDGSISIDLNVLLTEKQLSELRGVLFERSLDGVDSDD